MVFVYAESRFIWNIDIEGLERIDEAEFMQTLEECGLKTGMLKSKVKNQEIINKVRLSREDIAWMNIDQSRNKCNYTSCRNNCKTRNNTSR